MKHTKQDDIKPLNSLDFLAYRWSTTYRNLHRQVADGRIKAVKLNGILRIPQAEVEKIEKDGF